MIRGLVTVGVVVAGIAAGFAVPAALKALPEKSAKPVVLSQAVGEYFKEVALGAEFGEGEKIRKWEGDVRIQYVGTPTAEDLATLEQVVSEINKLVDGQIRLSLTTERPAITIHFAPVTEFPNIDPRFKKRNFGFFWAEYAEDLIVSADVLISTEGVTQKERSHLIREELTQALGLPKDSLKYPKSMFYQRWTATQVFSKEDELLIQFLYSPEVLPGMNGQEVTALIDSRLNTR